MHLKEVRRRVRAGSLGKLKAAVQSIFGSSGSDSELAAAGLTREEMDELRAAEVWPCCWKSVCVLLDMETQWRTAPGGIIGLDYSVLPFVLKNTGVQRADWPQVFSDIRVMEAAALSIFREVADG